MTKELTGSLSLLTWCTSDIEGASSVLEASGFVLEKKNVSSEDILPFYAYWGNSEDLGITLYEARTTLDFDIKMRIIHVPASTEASTSASIGLQSIRLKNDENKIAFTPTGSRLRESPATLLEEIDPHTILTIASDEYIEEVDFFTKVLGKKASLVGDDIVINSYADTADVISLERLEDDTYEDHVVSRYPNEGWVMTSYETWDIGEILARAHATQTKVYRTPRKLSDAILGTVITMSLLTPTGMVVEVYQSVKD